MDRTASVNTTGASRIDASCEALRQLIVTGELAPGSRILEADIANRFEVSRRTAQSALRRLQMEGLIQRPGGLRAAWIVAPLTIRGFHEIIEVIEAILSWSARRAARGDPEDRQGLVIELRAINDEFRAVRSEDPQDATRANDLDQRFHSLLVDRTAGSRLRSYYIAQFPALELYGRHYMPHLIDTTLTSADEHVAIIDAIERGDPDAAGHATWVNWTDAQERYDKAIKNAGERGTW